MNQWTITKRTFLGFSSIILAVMAFGGITLWELRKLNLGIHAMTGDSMPGATAILEIDREVKENLGLAQAHINSSDKPSVGFNQRKLVESSDQMTLAVATAKRWICVGLGLTLCLAVTLAWLNVRSINSALQKLAH